MNISFANDYSKDWKKVDSLDHKGLPKSALEVVNRIYNKAKAENNTGQLVKAVVHRLKFTSHSEEDAFVLSLIDLDKEIVKAPYPAKQVLHSMLAEMYWSYYEQNRYTFLQRTETKDFNNKDIRTWDLRTVVENVKQHYLASLEETNRLQETPIKVYELIIYQGSNTEKLRPTLYDFLANRAIDFFMSSESALTMPTEQFLINEDVFLSTPEIFSQYKIQTSDTLNFKYLGVTLLQNLISFRLKDKNTEALLDADLHRLSLMQQHSVDPLKDEKYLKALQALEEKYKTNEVSAQVSYHIALWWYQQGAKYNPLQNEVHKWDIKKAMETCMEVTARFKNSEGGQNCQSLSSNIQKKDLTLVMEEVNIPNQPFKTLVTYRNVKKLYFRLVKTSREEFKKIHKKGEYNYDNVYKEKLINFYAAKKPSHQYEVDLPDDGDFQQHHTEVKIPELPSGDYILLAGTNALLSYNDQAVAYDFITISDISYIHRTLTETGEIEFFTVSRKTGEPLAGVLAQAWNTVYNSAAGENESKKGELKISDKEGHFNFTPLNSTSNGFEVEFKHKGDYLFTRKLNDVNSYNHSFYAYKPYHYDGEGRKERRTFYFTDRAIYRPSQTIYFKGIALETDGKKQHDIKKNFPVSVTLYDVNGQQVSQLSLTTNEYGSFSGSFTAPSSGLNGMMTIRDAHGATNISVEDYKRPKFEVEIPNIKGAFRLNELIKVKGQAKAYSGANIDGAQVKYRVVRIAEFPSYWWFYRWGYYPTSPQLEIINGEAKTDEKGEFEVSFKAIPDLSVPKDSKPTFRYTVYADVTDQNGETRSAEKSIAVGYSSLKLNANTPAFFNREDNNALNITSSNLNDEFEPATGTITIYKLKDPGKVFRERMWTRPDRFTQTKEQFEKDFPEDEYADEGNPANWEKQTKVLDLKFDTQANRKVVLEEMKKWDQGKYVLEITAKDKFREEVKEISYFSLIDRKDKQVPFSTTDWFQPLKINVQPGEKAEILAGSSKKITVLYEIEKDSKIISKQWLTFDKEQKLLEIPVTEEYRGNIGLHYTFVNNSRLYKHTETIAVPYTNKMLDVSFETFRNKLLPGQKEEWKIRIKGKNGDKAAAELVATLYDASLDAFRANTFNFSLYPSFYPAMGWNSTKGFEKSEAQLHESGWNNSVGGYYKTYASLNWFDYGIYYYNRFYGGNRYPMKAMSRKGASSDDMEMKVAASAPAKTDEVVAVGYGTLAKRDISSSPKSEPAQSKKKDKRPVKARTNFNETAFFYPHLQTDANGDILISFTIPEALTRWKMLGFAHTQDLKYGFAQNELVTQKDLMITTNAPRFFRENDKIVFTSKVANISDKELTGNAELFLFDAITMKPIDNQLGNNQKSKSFTAKAGQSTGVSWELSIPEGVQAITYRVSAKAGNFSDGEEMAVPVLTNRMLVTESMPLPIRSKQTKIFTLDKLVNNRSTTLTNHKLTLEFTSNPAWYAVQALPYLMEYPYECAEQTFSRFYANSIASHIANSNPKIKRVFDSWKNVGSQALVSNLEKNQELKTLLLEETPWVMDAKDQTERKKRVALLFDLNKMSSELNRALKKLQKMQSGNGGWPWFEGMKESWYISQHIVTGMGHLDHLGVKNVRDDAATYEMVKKAVSFIDKEINERYEELLKMEKRKYLKLSDNNIGYMEIQYLYARSFFTDLPIPKSSKTAFDYFKGQAKKYWLNRNFYMEGMIALGLQRWGDVETPKAIIKSLREHAIVNEEMGMYWKADNGYFWYQAPVETQSLLIEAFDEIAKDQKAVDDMKVWLLKNKQTNDWQTTKATTEACYALLLKGTDWLASDALVEIKLGEIIVDPNKMPDVKVEAGTGYFKTSWSGSDIKPEMGKVTISKKDEGVSWGALYWQYFEQLDKITPHETPLKLKKQLFLQKNGTTGPVITPIDEKTVLAPGDLVKVRIELRVDREMEYVHMKDMRASAFEPLNVLSQFKYQDGLGYYESTRDAATNFFFDYLPKGTYVFEYPLRVTHQGDFSNGITSIQSMYAPEFSSHSEGVRVKVIKK